VLVAASQRLTHRLLPPHVDPPVMQSFPEPQSASDVQLFPLKSNRPHTVAPETSS
jgi:hypothetical protein